MMQSDDPGTGAALVTAPPPAAIEYQQRHRRQLRFLTWGYVVLLGCCSILSAAAAASQLAAGDALVGALLVLVCGQLGFICVNLAIAIGPQRGLHAAGSPECFAQVRLRYTESHRHLALTFAPGGPLTVEGVRPENAAEYMLLMSESADVEKHLAGLKERMEELRDVEHDAQEAETHAAGCSCVGCDDLD